ncbi:MAG: HDOD domain-containing protein [Betaproteobacteria bacterium]|jgi:EAL and modified HD-GYP domain-containing signal transduction protein
MTSWINKLFKTANPDPADPKASDGAPGAQAPSAGGSTEPEAGPERVVASDLQRRPLLHRDGHLAGFEVSAVTETARGAGLAAVLMHGMVSAAVHRRVALTTLTEKELCSPAVLEKIRPGMMFVVADAAAALSTQLPWVQDVRSRGGVLGTLAMPRAGASFVVLDAGNVTVSNLLSRAQACRAAAPGCQLLATGLRTIDDLEASLFGPFDMAAGLFDRVGERRESGTLSPNLNSLCRLLNRAMTEPDTRGLCQDIRGDIDLTYRLLRHANSPLLGLRRNVDSIEQALQLLGRQALFRLLTVLLVTRAGSRPTAVALHELALTRAHFMEEMADQIWAPAATLYTTGLLSLLDVMMQLPMEQVLAPIGLTQEARSALLHRSGPWHELLELARCLEMGQLEQARELAQPMGGLPFAQDAMERARASAAAISAELRDVWK